MLKLLKEKKRLTETLFMASLTALCFAMSVFRIFFSETKIFIFLNWNLFLAFLPWALTSIAILKPGTIKNPFIIVLIMAAWLLFFPNAPYILTDLFHLGKWSNMPVWFDLVLILSFAWTGLLFGFLSLWDIEKIISQRVHKFGVYALSSFLLFLGSFGIYVGRYLRWNSWDIISEPFSIMYDIGDRLTNPFDHPRTWGMTLFMGLFLNIIYWSIHLIRRRKV